MILFWLMAQNSADTTSGFPQGVIDGIKYFAPHPNFLQGFQACTP
jgi:hypothetical protein